MINIYHYITVPIVAADKSKTVQELDLYYNCGTHTKVGTILREERTWHDFLETEYRSSQGIVQKRTEMPDGTRCAEHYDAVKGIYESYQFDNVGTLLHKQTCDNFGHYETTERQHDGTYTTTKVTSVFVRMMPDTETK